MKVQHRRAVAAVLLGHAVAAGILRRTLSALLLGRAHAAVLLVMILASVPAVAGRLGVATLDAQSPTFGLGHTPTADELRAIDIEITPDGHGLPPGHGSAETGRTIFASRCAVCHGPNGKEGPQDVLVGGQGTLASSRGSRPVKTVGSYWPYATTLWDYLRRAMPFDHAGTLSNDDVYATTAYILFMNGVIGERDVLDEHTLPQIKMPNRDGFTADPRPDVGQTKKK